TDFIQGAAFHGETNPMQHEPCRLLSYADGTRNLVAGDSIFAVRQQPDRNQPLVESDSGILKDGSTLYGELATASLTLPALLGAQIVVVSLGAGRTGGDTILPTEVGNGV